MSRSHSKKTRGNGPSRWSVDRTARGNTQKDWAGFDRSTQEPFPHTGKLEVGEGGLRMGPEMLAKLRQLEAQGVSPDTPLNVRVAMPRPSDKVTVDENGVTVHHLTVDNPAVIEALSVAEDPAEAAHEMIQTGARAMETYRDATEGPIRFEPKAEDYAQAQVGRAGTFSSNGQGSPMLSGRTGHITLQPRPGSEQRSWHQDHPETWVMAADSVCPRCGGPVPDAEHVKERTEQWATMERRFRADTLEKMGVWRGALSRTDDVTEVCVPCGSDEALTAAAGVLAPQSEWPVERIPPRPSGGYRESWSDIRGNHRVPRQVVPTPRELPDLRLHLMERWMPQGQFERRQVEEGVAVGARELTPKEQRAAAYLDAEFHRKTLSEASLWWVRDEMVDLVALGAKSMPTDMRAKDLDLPLDHDAGMAVLAKPFVGTDAFDPGRPVYVDVMTWSRGLSATGHVPCISLAMYRYFDFSGGLSPDALQDAVASGAIYDSSVQRIINQANRRGGGGMADRLVGGAWTYVGRTDWPLADELEGFHAFGDAGEAEPTPQQRVSMIEDRRFFAAFCVLVAHKLSQLDDQPAERAVRRRMERAGVVDKEVSTVRIVRLRDVKRKPGETAADHEKRNVEWTHRWMVSAHWAWRRCGPGHVDRRWVPISPYPKGPEDLPLVLKETVHVFTR